MSTVENADVPAAIQDRTRQAFDRFVPLARRGLEAMLVDDGSMFCFKAFAGAGKSGLRLEGRSERYSAMVLIGLARQAQLGRAELDPPMAPVVDRLVAWADDAQSLGDSGLVLWTLLLRGDERAEALARRIVERGDRVRDPDYGFSSMDMGCLLAGVAEAVRAGLDVPGLRELGADVSARLLRSQGAESDLFSFAQRVRRRNFHRTRFDSRLGSFASQVYPTIGLGAWARATDDAEARSAAVRCADRLRALQGSDGQWWWVYHQTKPAVAVRYPVYTVHQDAMGPMALCAAALADGATERYDDAIWKSLAWFDVRPERAADHLIDAERGVVWRAVQHDDPARSGMLGLGPGELRRLARVTWLGSVDSRPLDGGFTCPECRPYHLGWILLADALWRELVAARG